VAWMNFGVSISAGTVCDLPARVVAEVALPADETTFVTAEPMRGVRYLVASDLRIFGQDRDGSSSARACASTHRCTMLSTPTDSSSTAALLEPGADGDLGGLDGVREQDMNTLPCAHDRAAL
jgi:hypothetical protein